MQVENLLKSISELLKKNEQFFIDNPEAFEVVEDRLMKAIDDDDFEQYEEEQMMAPMDDEQDFAQDDVWGLFDDPEQSLEGQEQDFYGEQPSELDLEADKILQGGGQAPMQQPQAEEAAPVEEAAPAQQERKVSSSGYSDWMAREDYGEHAENVQKLIDEGWSPREAERLAGAHEAPTNFMDALKHKVRGSEPSPKMLETMKGLAGDWLRNAERHAGKAADPKKQPIKYAAEKALAAHEDAHGSFRDAYNEFLQSDEMKDLRGRDRAKAIREFKQQYLTDNPAHREGAIAAADTGKTFGEAMSEREKFRTEGQEAIMDAGKIGDPSDLAGEFSAAAAGGMEGMTSQGAAQMAGGAQEEGGYQAGIVKDPNMHFAEQNPEYVEKLKADKMKKLQSQLKPDALQRLNALGAHKKKGDE